MTSVDFLTFRMIIRIQSPDGMQRVNIDQNKSNLDLYSEVEKVPRVVGQRGFQQLFFLAFES